MGSFELLEVMELFFLEISMFLSDEVFFDEQMYDSQHLAHYIEPNPNNNRGAAETNRSFAAVLAGAAQHGKF